MNAQPSARESNTTPHLRNDGPAQESRFVSITIPEHRRCATEHEHDLFNARTAAITGWPRLIFHL